MDLNEIKIYLEENKDTEEVKGYMNGLSTVTVDSANNFLNTEDGKKLLQPKLDTYHSKGMDSWKANNLDKLYTDRFNLENPTADPKEIANNKKMADFETKIANMEKESTRKELTNKALKLAGEKQLPLDLIDFMVADTEENTNANITKLESVFMNTVNKMVDERLRGNTPGGGGTPPSNNPFTPGPNFNLTEQGRLFKENPTLAKSLMANK